MKWIFVLTLAGGIFLGSDGGVYIISRVYEGAFFYQQYNYFGLENKTDYAQSLSFGEKLVCLKEDDSREMRECLQGKDLTSYQILSQNQSRKTERALINGREYVVKRHIQKGFWKNLFCMGKCVSIWNNIYWGKLKKLPLIDPVAFYEKRNVFQVMTTVIYRFEATRLDDASQLEVQEKTHLILNMLRKQNVVHADLRRRNMVCRELEDQVKLIDIELMHFYPSFSYVCQKRLLKEEKWLLEDCKH